MTMNERHPKLSVIIPVYNVEQFLPECVDSILNQNYTDFELILINDGSKDHSGDICDNYAKKHSFIKAIQQENKGQMKATLRGLQEATGNYISFIDSDDYISPITFEKMMEAAAEYDSDIIDMSGVRFQGTTEKSFEDKIPAGHYDRKAIEEYILPNLFSNHDLYGNRGIQPSKCLKIFKSELIRKAYSLIPNDIEMGEDLLTTYTAIAYADSITILDKQYIGYHYRLNEDSISWVYKKKLMDKSMKLCTTLRNIDPVEDMQIYQDELDYEVCFFAINAFLNEYLMKNSNSLSTKKDNLKEIINRPEVKTSITNINIAEVKMPNKLFVKLMKKRRLGSLHFIGCLISILRKPITSISQKVI